MNKALYEKLLQVQKHLDTLNIDTDSSVNYGKTKFKYLSLRKLLPIVRSICDQYGLHFTQTYDIMCFDGYGPREILVTTISLGDEEIVSKNLLDKFIIKETTVKKNKDGSETTITKTYTEDKDWGGHTTYKRRYSIFAMLGIHQGNEENNPETKHLKQEPTLTSGEIKFIKDNVKKDKSAVDRLIKFLKSKNIGKLEECPKRYFDEIDKVIKCLS